MYAIAFDMVISDLQKYYGEPYNKAYYEIKELLKKNGFEWVQGSTYMTMNDDLTALVKTVMELSKIEWFKKSVRDLREDSKLKVGRTLLIWLNTHRIGDSPPIRDRLFVCPAFFRPVRLARPEG